MYRQESGQRHGNCVGEGGSKQGAIEDVGFRALIVHLRSMMGIIWVVLIRDCIGIAVP